MKVGFYHAAIIGDRRSTETVSNMIRSVRKAMRGVELYQFTDVAASVIPGPDGWLSYGVGPLALKCLEAYAAQAGEWLFVDTDVIVRQDVRDVFKQRFDVAVASREGTLKGEEIGSKFMARMPYNKGAVFSRSQDFWLEAFAQCLDMSPERQQWMGDQQAMNDVIATKQFKVRVLPSRYNYAPLTQHDGVSEQAAIVHYKGRRKAWLREVAS